MDYLTDKQKVILKTLGYDNDIAFLSHFPFRYDYRFQKRFDMWEEGEEVIFSGDLISPFSVVRYQGNKSLTHFKVRTAGQDINVTVFFSPYLKQEQYQSGITVTGVYKGKNKVIAKSISNKPIEVLEGIHPVYSTKKGIKHFEIVRLMKRILETASIDNLVPESLVDRYRLLDRHTALMYVHFPKSSEEIEFGLRTLKYEEFLLYHLYQQMNQSNRLHKERIQMDYDALAQRIASLPYTLTHDQTTVVKEIMTDLEAPRQMHRLLQGDVGSGKTVVSLLVACAMIDAGYQVVFMVPTDVLMEQHHRTVMGLFPELAVATLSQATQNKMEVLADIESGKVGLILGTHAVFQSGVSYHNLGLVIIDEQHRFGVKQREKLISKAYKPDILLLSATPIPRTLAASLFFDLDVSTIETSPAHKKPIQTIFIEENSMRSILGSIRASLAQGEQVYIVCPSIEDGVRGRDVTGIHEQMVTQLDGFVVSLLHGNMKASEKDDVMRRFQDGKIDVLVSTTVIEVGIDVHNANTIVIYNAELFGLATLHQLRGRVGRGKGQGVCYLLSDNKDEGKKRLELLSRETNGFELSLYDLRNRGMGDLLGSRQSGIPSFILGDIEADVKILNQAKLDAKAILSDKDNKDYRLILTVASSVKNNLDGI